MLFVPKFPEFSGPYKVGTIDVEIPLDELRSPSPSPLDDDSKVKTILYRIFYPCDPETKNEYADWLPQPQRAYLAGYCRLLNVKSNVASCLSYIPNPFSFIKIPARIDAPILKANNLNNRWPVMIFSHGLGGTRNTYSFIAGSISSYGMIVITPEHRDGSAPISFIRNLSPEAKGLKQTLSDDQSVDYIQLPHVASSTVEEARNSQLKIRLWELGLVHDSLLKINDGIPIKNLSPSSFILDSVKGMMDLETPGKISFAGHSFGAATITQFVKSTFYASSVYQAPKDFEPLFKPDSTATITKQIIESTPVILLDVWCLPLKAETTRWLWNRPLPSYNNEKSPGGKVILAIESASFYNWDEHLQTTKKLLSPSPSSSINLEAVRNDISTWKEPYFYYAENSAHISQSDFGLLYPSITNKFLGCEEPERLMMLQVRAIVQFLRNQDIEISPLSSKDKEINKNNEGIESDDDTYILGDKQQVRGWIRISTFLDKNYNIKVDDDGNDDGKAIT